MNFGGNGEGIETRQYKDKAKTPASEGGRYKSGLRTR